MAYANVQIRRRAHAKIKRLLPGVTFISAVDALLTGWEALSDEQRQQVIAKTVTSHNYAGRGRPRSRPIEGRAA